jgi:hypothetical protein
MKPGFDGLFLEVAPKNRLVRQLADAAARTKKGRRRLSRLREAAESGDASATPAQIKVLREILEDE